MNNSKKDVENAILLIAEIYGKKDNFIAILNSSFSLPRIIEAIVYEMFLNKFHYSSCLTEQYYAYKIILEYSTELNKNGFVEFN